MSEKKRPSGLIEMLKTGTLHGAIPTASTFALLEWVEHLEKSMKGMELAPVGTRELIKDAYELLMDIPLPKMGNPLREEIAGDRKEIRKRTKEILSRYPQP